MTDFRNHPHIEMVSPDTLIIPKGHARTHSPKQVEQIRFSVDRFGFIVPVITDENGVVTSGAGRLMAARALKLDLIPVIRVQFVSEADRIAFSLADNRLAEFSGWDEELLQASLDLLFEAEYDFAVTGFDLDDLDIGVPKAEAEPPGELPNADGIAVSRTGDLWTIGDQRLFCGNAREIESYETLLGDDRATMIFTDAPYNVPINGHVSGLGKHKHREFAEASGEMSPPEFTNFLRSYMRLCVRFAVGGSIHFHCMDWRHLREILDAADGVYTEFKQLAVWVKGAGGMGAFYRSRHELVLIFKSGTAPHINTFGLGAKGRYRTNVWEVAGANTFGKGRDADLAAHPTCKPVALVADAILDCSHRGDLVLDPFCGSGSTLLSAHRTKRRGAGIEIDPLYVDVALRRLMRVMGTQAILADGRTFDEVAAARANEEKLDG